MKAFLLSLLLLSRPLWAMDLSVNGAAFTGQHLCFGASTAERETARRYIQETLLPLAPAEYLPQRLTVYFETNITESNSSANTIFMGTCAGRRQRPQSWTSIQTIFIHEWGHILFNTAMAKRGIVGCTQCLGAFYQIPLSEIFSDLVAALVAGDPAAVPNAAAALRLEFPDRGLQAQFARIFPARSFTHNTPLAPTRRMDFAGDDFNVFAYALFNPLRTELWAAARSQGTTPAALKAILDLFMDFQAQPSATASPTDQQQRYRKAYDERETATQFLRQLFTFYTEKSEQL